MLPALPVGWVVPNFDIFSILQLHFIVAVPAQQLVHGALSKVLHLLVDLPLDRVGRLPAPLAVVFRGSPFLLHLCHLSPGVRGGNDCGCGGGLGARRGTTRGAALPQGWRSARALLLPGGEGAVGPPCTGERRCPDESAIFRARVCLHGAGRRGASG